MHRARRLLRQAQDRVEQAPLELQVAPLLGVGVPAGERAAADKAAHAEAAALKSNVASLESQKAALEANAKELAARAERAEGDARKLAEETAALKEAKERAERELKAEKKRLQEEHEKLKQRLQEEMERREKLGETGVMTHFRALKTVMARMQAELRVERASGRAPCGGPHEVLSIEVGELDTSLARERVVAAQQDGGAHV